VQTGNLQPRAPPPLVPPRHEPAHPRNRCWRPPRRTAHHGSQGYLQNFQETASRAARVLATIPGANRRRQGGRTAQQLRRLGQEVQRYRVCQRVARPRTVKRSPTAVRPLTSPRQGKPVNESTGQTVDHLCRRSHPADLIPNRKVLSSPLRLLDAQDLAAFPLVSVVLVGATGFEPVTSSVSANSGEALCGPPFSQVAVDRRGRS
jgi:hypothetical protein